MFWDKIAGVYDLFGYFYNGKANKELCNEVISHIENKDVVLECACGTGMISEKIATKCKRLVATDYSEGMLKQTRKKCKKYNNVEIRKADITKLDFPDNSFDVVVAANIIHLLDEPYKTVEELNRVCKIGGIIIIPTYVNKEKKEDINIFVKTVDKVGAEFKQQFTYTSYINFIKDTGYDVIETKLINGRIPCAIAVIKK